MSTNVLPNCFDATCVCGWSGQLTQGVLYVVGAGDVPLDDGDPNLQRPKCPECGSVPTRALLPLHLGGPQAMRDRMEWYLHNLGAFGVYVRGRGRDAFPCRCTPYHKCELVGGWEFKREVIADTAGPPRDWEWLRIVSNVVCAACRAVGRVAMLEAHDAQSVFAFERAARGEQTIQRGQAPPNQVPFVGPPPLPGFTSGAIGGSRSPVLYSGAIVGPIGQPFGQQWFQPSATPPEPDTAEMIRDRFETWWDRDGRPRAQEIYGDRLGIPYYLNLAERIAWEAWKAR